MNSTPLQGEKRAPGKPKEISGQKLLIGEGTDDAYFFRAFVKHLQLDDIQVLDYAGKSNLSEFIKSLPVLPGFGQLRSIGITRDADTDAAAAFQSIRDALERASLPVPLCLAKVAAGTPNVSVFILPNCKDPGMLEDLCIESIKSKPEWVCVDAFFDCVERQMKRRPKPSTMSKARTRVWLTTCDEPDKLIGQAAEAGYWEWTHPAFSSLESFVRGL